MKNLLRLEELVQFIFGIVMFCALDYAWWVFPALLLLPDIGMLGYLINPKVGALLYNIFHHKGLAILTILLGYFFLGEFYTLIGVILFSHAAMDRCFGYGLKYPDSFSNTHLGNLEKRNR